MLALTLALTLKNMSHVVIVESPAKCKTINKYLGKDYKVLASYGHIRDLPSKDGSVLPDKDFEMKYQVSKGSSKHIKEIEDAVKKADSLILATDPDREGEAISWHVYEVLKKDKVIDDKFPVKRVAFNSITKSAVQDAIDNPRTLDTNLINSQQARRALDYLVGFTLSPVLWRKLPGSKSAGRVQSVALRLICERENEIEAFRAQEYWSISGVFKDGKKNLIPSRLSIADGKKLEKLSIGKKGEADRILAEIAKRDFAVSNVESKQVKRHPKPPFITSTLQQEASRKLGFSASRTMSIAQKLYEGINIGSETTGVITYMRTDGVTVAPEGIQMTRQAIENEFGAKYLPKAARAYSSKQKNSQEAHEAIRPTDPRRTPKSLKQYLTDEQYKLYDLIWKRMVASQMESAILNQVAVDIASGDGKYNFRASGNSIVFDGFFRLYREGIDDKDDEDAEKLLPSLNKGDQVNFAKKTEKDNPLAEQHFTQPPPRYNEASLVKKMEELGIGRPSTYASIISILISREYVRMEQRRFHPEVRGRVVTAFLEEYFKKYVEYNFTADLEDKLDMISEGKVDWRKALEEFWTDFKKNIDSTLEITLTDVIENLDNSLESVFFSAEDVEKKRKCPSCNDGRLGLKIGKFGPFIGCSNYPECRHTVQLDKFLNPDEEGETEQQQERFEPKVLGKDDSGEEITLRKGPYGFYLQLGEGKGKVKPKRSSLPKGYSPDEIGFERAKDLLSLPKVLGKHPETGEDVTVANGRYGPYVSHNKKFASIQSDQLFTLSLDEAVEIIDNAPEKKAKSSGKKAKGSGKKS
jgi:DNA topoisomerase-1